MSSLRQVHVHFYITLIKRRHNHTLLEDFSESFFWNKSRAVQFRPLLLFPWSDTHTCTSCIHTLPRSIWKFEGARGSGIETNLRSRPPSKTSKIRSPSDIPQKHNSSLGILRTVFAVLHCLFSQSPLFTLKMGGREQVSSDVVPRQREEGLVRTAGLPDGRPGLFLWSGLCRLLL